MNVISYISMKGGVGKSTNCVFTANCLAKRGYRVLIVDLDGNNSTSIYYTTGLPNIEEISETQNIFEALTHRDAQRYIIQSRKKNIDIIMSSLKLADIRTIDYKTLKKILPQEYDYIIIDTAPTYDNHTQSAIYASDLILTPLELTSFNLTTTAYLQSKLYDEFPEKVENWYLLYSQWSESYAQFETSLQSQFVNLFEQTFANILDVKIPNTPIVNKYTQADKTVSKNSRVIGTVRLWEAFNNLVSMITGESTTLVEEF